MKNMLAMVSCAQQTWWNYHYNFPSLTSRFQKAKDEENAKIQWSKKEDSRRTLQAQVEAKMQQKKRKEADMREREIKEIQDDRKRDEEAKLKGKM